MQCSIVYIIIKRDYTNRKRTLTSKPDKFNIDSLNVQIIFNHQSVLLYNRFKPVLSLVLSLVLSIKGVFGVRLNSELSCKYTRGGVHSEPVHGMLQVKDFEEMGLCYSFWRRFSNKTV